MAITVQLPKDGSGFEAEVRVGDDLHLVLRAVNTAVGPVMNIYDAKIGRWRLPEYARSIDEAKEAAEKIARHKYNRLKNKEPLAIDWEEIESSASA